MEFKEYMAVVQEFARYPGKGSLQGLQYCALGLGEAGEVQGEVKKLIRDDGGLMTESRREKIADELGDNLWYIIHTAKEAGVLMETVMAMNAAKLRGRYASSG